MTPERLTECLSTIRWNPNTLAEAMDVPAQAVDDWLSGREDIPRKVAAWLAIWVGNRQNNVEQVRSSSVNSGAPTPRDSA